MGEGLGEGDQARDFSLVASIRNERADRLRVHSRHDRRLAEVALLLSRLRAQDMAEIRLAALDLATGSLLEALRRTAVSFQFWHSFPPHRFGHFVNRADVPRDPTVQQTHRGQRPHQLRYPAAAARPFPVPLLCRQR